MQRSRSRRPAREVSEAAPDAGTWANWSGTEQASPVRQVHPADAEELAAQIRAASAQGLRVKAVGSGHSFTGIAVTDGVLVHLDRMNRLRSLDRVTGLVTVEAGIRLRRLNRMLDEHGLAMANLGDIDVQTLSGAISTGTHGTGLRLGGLATQVAGLELVTADGEVRRCSADNDPELFAAARIGLGALGIITAVTLQCVPSFALRATEAPMPLAEVLEGFDELATRNDHFEFYWFPHTDRALTKRNNRVAAGEPMRPVPRARGWVDDELLSNTVFGWTNRLTARVPATTRRVNSVAARALSAREYVDASYRVFCSPRRVVFREMEYAVPRESLVDVLRSVQAWIDSSGERIPFPVEVRVAAPDDIWLSTAYQRDTAYLAVHQYQRLSHERYFHAVESIVGGVGGRPHWGKLHEQDATTLERLYPRFQDWRAVRARVDPGGIFANAYLDRVVGFPT
jgi:L-gulonolactone oxidase